MKITKTPKTVLITGCSSGYGAATARYFHDHGWNVIATMRSPQLGALPKADRLRVLALDVTKYQPSTRLSKSSMMSITRPGKMALSGCRFTSLRYRRAACTCIQSKLRWRPRLIQPSSSQSRHQVS